jgi:hypothetical protein
MHLDPFNTETDTPYSKLKQYLEEQNKLKCTATPAFSQVAHLSEEPPIAVLVQ